MKKAIFLFLLLVMVGSVMAGTIGPIQYKDKKCIFWDTTRSTKTQDTFIDADTVNGQDPFQYIEENEESWKVDTFYEPDGDGLSKSTLGWLLTGERNLFANRYTFDQWLMDNYVPRDVFNELEDRVDILAARLELPKNASQEDILMKAALIRSQRIGQTAHLRDYQCNFVTGMCLELIN